MDIQDPMASMYENVERLQVGTCCACRKLCSIPVLASWLLGGWSFVIIGFHDFAMLFHGSLWFLQWFSLNLMNFISFQRRHWFYESPVPGSRGPGSTLRQDLLPHWNLCSIPGWLLGVPRFSLILNLYVFYNVKHKVLLISIDFIAFPWFSWI